MPVTIPPATMRTADGRIANTARNSPIATITTDSTRLATVIVGS